MLAELDLLPGAMVFRAEAGDLVEADDLLARAWDLDTPGRGVHRVRRRRSRTARRATDEARCAALVELVHAWRRFPFIDPEHPGPPAPAALARPHGPRRVRRAPRRVVARRRPLVRVAEAPRRASRGPHVLVTSVTRASDDLRQHLDVTHEML